MRLQWPSRAGGERVASVTQEWTTWVRTRAQEDDQERLRRYRQGWEAYYGNHPKPLRVRRVETIAGGVTHAATIDDNVLLPWAAEIVDTGVSYLFGDDTRFSVEEDAPDEAQDWLDAVWAANRRMTTLQKWGVNGAVCGHGYLFIAPRQSAEAGSIRANPELLRLVPLDPANVSVAWDPEDVDRAVRYTVEWTAEDPWTGDAIMRRRVITDQGGSWEVAESVMREGMSDYRLMAEPTLWPYPWPPMVDAQNLPLPNVYYGLADLDPVVVRLIRAANARASDLARTHRMHAHPQPYAPGLTAQQVTQLSLGIDTLIGLPNPDARLELLEIGSTASTSLEYVRWLKEQVREASRTPEVASGKVENVGALSGVALNILFQPLVAKTQSKRRTYGEALSQLNAHLLELAGWPGLSVTNDWPEITPGDVLTEATVAETKRRLGVSTETLLGELGYDPSEEEARRVGDNEEALRNTGLGIGPVI